MICPPNIRDLLRRPGTRSSTETPQPKHGTFHLLAANAFAHVRILMLLSTACILFACSRSARPTITDKVPLGRVHGIVLVDDVPQAGVHIQYVPQQELAEKRERYLNRFFTWTGDGGRFALSTYVNGDGVPYGEYALEFKWVEQKLAGEEDRFDGRYANPASPFMMIEVKEQRDLDLGTIRLKTRATPRD